MRRVFYISAIAALILAACGKPAENSNYGQLVQKRDSLKKEYKALGKSIREVEKELENFETEGKKTLVSSWELKTSEFEHYFKVHGVVQANKNVMLYAEASAVIKKIYVVEGQRVNAGALLVEMDGEMIENSIKELETNLELATEIYQRQAKLWEQNIGSEIQYLEAKNRKESLEQSLATMKVQLRKTKVYAPFAGVIDKVFPREGELAGMLSPMVRLINLDKVYVQSDVSEKYIGVMTAGTYAEVSFPSIDLTYETKVSRVGQYINPNNRSFEMQIDLLNVNNAIKPNLLAEVKVRDMYADSAIVIPSRLLQEDPQGNSFVYLMESTEASHYVVVKRYVEAGMSYDGRTHILSGLKEGDVLVDKGSRSIQDGQEVSLYVEKAEQ